MATEIKIDLVADLAVAEIERFNKSIKSTDKAFSSFSDKLKSSTSQIPNNINQATESFNTFNNSLVGIGSTIAGVFAFNKIVGFFSDAISEAQKFENALIGINSVAKATGNNVDEVGIAVKKLAEDGLVPVNEVASSLKNLLASGLNLDQSVKLFNALKDSAAFNRQGFLSLGEAVTGATQGIKNGISVLVDNAGITKNLSILEKEYAESIGTTVGKLTEAERIQARYVGILKESSIFTGDADKLTKTYSGSVAQLSANFSIFLSNIGSFFTKNNLIIAGIKTLNESLTDLNTVLNGVSDTELLKRTREELSKLAQSGETDGKRYEFLVKQLERLSSTLKETGKVELTPNQEFRKAQIQVAKETADEQIKQNQKVSAEAIKEYDKILEKYKNVGKTQLQILQDQRDADLKIAKDNQGLKLKIVQKYEQDKAKLQKEAQSKRDQDEANQFQKQQKRLREIENTFKPVFAAFQDVLTGNAKGFISNLPSLVTGVATGVKDLGGNLGKFAGLAGPEAALISQIAGPFLGILSQGKDAVRGAIEEFAAQLPELLTSIIEGLAEAIPAIIEKVPQIIDALVRDLPRIITALAQSMPQVGVQLGLQMPQVAITFATSLIEQAPEIAQAVIKAFTVDAAKGTVKGVGGFFKSIGFAEGGQGFIKQVPSGYNNDTFPARLTSGELVVDRSTASKLKSFLNNSDEMLMAMMTQPILVQVDGRTIAKAVRNQTRQGFVL